MVFVVASVAGPLLGGLFTDHASLALGLLRQPADRRGGAGHQHPAAATGGSGRARIDYLGPPCWAPALTAMLLVTTWGGREYAWDSSQIVGLAVAAVVLLARFFAQERRAPEPVLPLRLFREPVFDVVSAPCS